MPSSSSSSSSDKHRARWVSGEPVNYDFRDFKEIGGKMNDILKKLDCIYDNRLLEITTGESETVPRAEVEVLLQCIRDLREQNLILVETAIELEREALSRVAAAEKLLEKSTSAKECMLQLQQYNKTFHDQIKNYYVVVKQLQEWQDKCSALEDHNCNLLHDINSLVQLISHARNTGRWDVGNLEFCEVTFEQVFGSMERLSTSSVGEWSNHEESSWKNGPKRNVNTCDIYGGSSRASSTSHTSLHNLLSPNSGFVPTNRDAQMVKLQLQLKQSQQHAIDLQHQVLEKDGTIVNLQQQLATLQHDNAVQETECFSHLETLRELNQQSRKDGMEISRLSEQNKQLLHGVFDNEVPARSLRDSEALRIEELSAELRKSTAKVQQLEEELNRSKQMTNGDTIQELHPDLDNLKILEARHRLKAEGLEVVIHQLNLQIKDLEQKEQTKTDLNQEKLAKKVLNLKQRLKEQQQISASQNAEMENQMMTIRNLQEALITLKCGHNVTNAAKKTGSVSSEIFDI